MKTSQLIPTILIATILLAGCTSTSEENLVGNAPGNTFTTLACDAVDPVYKGTSSFTVEVKMAQGDLMMKGKSGKGVFYEGPVTGFGESHYVIDNPIAGQVYLLEYWEDPALDPRVGALFTIEDGNGGIIRQVDMACRT